ncbi:hypothetical protein LO772_19435 [Yinghuangia sp. ASG 101]|uniref:hypothetical protein n=1 Tax=Yinghuangia sp. ASG 101 TaxID=2896848 RepID=UPI001E357A25|nr:hypothetical protein [Yinghuangia sp. ASG 101]UGQ09131.1 hypothetical protein LO772_19435 [Yinghuangia sp. ASG 101]
MRSRQFTASGRRHRTPWPAAAVLATVGIAALAAVVTNTADAAVARPTTPASPPTATDHTPQTDATGGTESTGSTDTTAQTEEFSACMRANGVPDFPGVTIGTDGRVTLIPNDTGVNVFSSHYRAAAETCAHLLPGDRALPAPPTPPSVPTPALAGTFPSPPTAPEPPTAPN